MLETTVRISGDLRVFRREFEAAVSQPPDYRLRSLLTHMGISKDDIVSRKIKCNGYIDYFEGDDSEFKLDILSEAGESGMDAIEMFLEKYAPDARVLYVSTDPEYDIYLTNDRNIEGLYYIEIYDCRLDLGYETDTCTSDELKEMLENILEMKDGIRNLIDAALSEYSISLSRYEYRELKDLY